MLLVKKLYPTAVLPICAHPGEDLGFDLFSDESVVINPGERATIRTGIAAQFMAVRPVQGRLVGSVSYERVPYGLLIRDRSSMAKSGVVVSGGVVDAGYTGEISVLLTNLSTEPATIQVGAKIAQMLPVPVVTGAPVKEVEHLVDGIRGAAGFGSTGG